MENEKIFTSKRYIKDLVDALNRIDELASITTADNDNGEAEQQEKDYDLLYLFLINQ